MKKKKKTFSAEINIKPGVQTLFELAFFSIRNVNVLKGFFSLHYPETVVENTITHFIETKVTENACPKQRVSDEQALVRIVLPFKDQKSANAVRHQLSDRSRQIDADVHPVYTSQKIKEKNKPKEH